MTSKLLPVVTCDLTVGVSTWTEGKKGDEMKRRKWASSAFVRVGQKMMGFFVNILTSSGCYGFFSTDIFLFNIYQHVIKSEWNVFIEMWPSRCYTRHKCCSGYCSSSKIAFVFNEIVNDDWCSSTIAMPWTIRLNVLQSGQRYWSAYSSLCCQCCFLRLRTSRMGPSLLPRLLTQRRRMNWRTTW